jgi:hypothetical protein
MGFHDPEVEVSERQMQGEGRGAALLYWVERDRSARPGRSEIKSATMNLVDWKLGGWNFNAHGDDEGRMIGLCACETEPG